MTDMKETDCSLEEFESELNNESDEDLMGFECFKYVNDYSPFKFNEKLIEKKCDKYFAFKICSNSTENLNQKNNNQNASSLIEEKINQKENNLKIDNKKEKNENNKNTSYNSYKNFYYKDFGNANQSDDDMREVEEGEMESEENDDENEEGELFEEDFQDFEDDMGIKNFDARKDSCIKTAVVNIIETYNKIKPNSFSLVNNNEEEEKEKEILTNPSEPKKNNGKDNVYNDLIVCKDDEIKIDNYIYTIIDLLGTGISGQTFKVFCKNDNKYYALKIIKNEPVLTKMSNYEYLIMKKLNDLDKNDQYHIIRSYNCFKFNNHLCIVNELMQKTLLEILKVNSSVGLSLTSIRFITKQILKAVEFIHNSDFIHTDLKPENILLSIQNENNVNTNNQASQNTDLITNKVLVKIADFGSAIMKKDIIRKEYIQSMYYRAPEVIIGLPLNEKVDVWSIACILIELYISTPIMPGTSSYDQLYKINTLIGECPQHLIEFSKKGYKYFIKDKETSYYRIKTPKEYYSEYPKDKPKEYYPIPEKMRNIDELINIKKDTIKSKNSRIKSLNNSSMSINSTNIKDELVAFIHLLKGMLQIDPSKRWSCKQCLKHPFITKEKLDKFISFELNEINQFMSNSVNFNNKSNIQNNHRSQMNKSFNNNYNINNFGGQLNYSFGNFNNNNLNFIKYFQNNPKNTNANNQNNAFPKNENYNQFNNNQNYNFNKNYTNYNNQKLNSSFSYNIYQRSFEPHPGIPQYFIPQNNFLMYNNMYYPNNFYYYNNNLYGKQNKSFYSVPHQNLNSSYNSSKGQNSSNNMLMFPNKQNFNRNKQFNKNEAFFKKNNVSNNFEESKTETNNNNNNNTKK